ncbi:MAG: ABC transporter permease subunit, partial [Ottowia sp.]|nr:ABC transporter permease subunit [Ottowia sp.]
YEAARIEGCSEFRIMWQIAVPLTVPTIATLALFYAVPTALLWRRWRRAWRGASPDAERAAAALCGLMTVAGYLVFGVTQIMFAHNNGNMLYLFGVSLWLASSAPEQGEGEA